MTTSKKPRRVGVPYVRRTYNRFKERFFSDRDLPEWKDLEIQFDEIPLQDWGEVEWESDGQVHILRLDHVLRFWPETLKMILLHEMVHMSIGSKYGHGNKFWAEALRALGLGAIRECF